MKSDALRTAVAAALLGTVTLPAAAQSGGSAMDWRVTPYVWATDITADFRNRSADVSFSDIMDKRDFAMLLRVETQGDDWGLLADLVFLNLGDDRTLAATRAKTDLKTTIFDLAAVYSPGRERFMGFEGFAGLRYVGSEFSTELTRTNSALPPRTLGFDTSFTDLLVGARYSFPLSDQWSMGLGADASFGDTEGTWSAAVTAERKLGSGALQIGYRYMDMQLESRDQTLDITMYGPKVAYTFKF
jgi:hypothetical protein